MIASRKQCDCDEGDTGDDRGGQRGEHEGPNADGNETVNVDAESEREHRGREQRRLNGAAGGDDLIRKWNERAQQHHRNKADHEQRHNRGIGSAL